MLKKRYSIKNRRPIRYENWNGAIAIRYDGNIVFYLHYSYIKVVEKSNEENLKEIKNTLSNKSENPESLKK